MEVNNSNLRKKRTMMPSKTINEDHMHQYLDLRPLNEQEAFRCVNLIFYELEEPQLT